MRVWIGCLACYNEGNLIGGWYDAIEADEVTSRSLHGAHIKRDDDFLDLLAASHEELWVMDMDETRGWLTEECSPMEAARIARTIESIEDQHDEPEAVLAWAQHEGIVQEIIADEYDHMQQLSFMDAYCGEYDNEKDYAYTLADDLGIFHEVQDSILETYFDYDAFARDLFMGDNYSVDVPGGGVYVFRSN